MKTVGRPVGRGAAGAGAGGGADGCGLGDAGGRNRRGSHRGRVGVGCGRGRHVRRVGGGGSERRFAPGPTLHERGPRVEVAGCGRSRAARSSRSVEVREDLVDRAAPGIADGACRRVGPRLLGAGEGGLELGGALETVLASLLERPVDGVAQPGGDVGVEGEVPRNRLRDLLHGDPERRVGREGKDSREHLEGDDPERVDVAPRVGGLPHRLLGRDVVRRAEDDGVERQLLVHEAAREAEVEDRHRVPLAHDDVLALQVPVDDSLLVRRLCPQADLTEDRERAGRGDPALFEDERLEVLARDELHRDVGVSRGGAEVVHPGDVRVLHLTVQADLALEAGDHRPVVVRDVAVEDLDREDLVEDQVPRLEDDAHPAPAEKLEPLVPRERWRRTGYERCRGSFRVPGSRANASSPAGLPLSPDAPRAGLVLVAEPAGTGRSPRAVLLPTR